GGHGVPRTRFRPGARSDRGGRVGEGSEVRAEAVEGPRCGGSRGGATSGGGGSPGVRGAGGRLRAAGGRELVLGVPDPLLDLPAVGARLAGVDARQLGPRLLELGTGALVVDRLDVDRVVDERERPVELDLEEPGARGERLDLGAAEVDA